MKQRYGENRKRPERVINKDRRGRKSEKKIKSSSASSGFYYSFLTVILLLCLFQVTVSAVLNISKIISYKAKLR